MVIFNKKVMIVFFFVLLVILVIIVYFVNAKKGDTSLEIKSVPDKIEVVINNQIYETPLKMRFEPGKYTIWGLKEKYQMYQQDFEVKKGKTNKLKIVLQPETDPEPPEGAPIN